MFLTPCLPHSPRNVISHVHQDDPIDPGALGNPLRHGWPRERLARFNQAQKALGNPELLRGFDLREVMRVAIRLERMHG